MGAAKDQGVDLRSLLSIYFTNVALQRNST
jgi:hypothetical protein